MRLMVDVASIPAVAQCRACLRKTAVEAGQRLPITCSCGGILVWITDPQVERVAVPRSDRSQDPYTATDFALDVDRWLRLALPAGYDTRLQWELVLEWRLCCQASFAACASAWTRWSGVRTSKSKIRRLLAWWSEAWEEGMSEGVRLA